MNISGGYIAKASKDLFISSGNATAKDICMIDRKIGRQFTGFSLIGVINTIIHLLIVTSLVEIYVVHPILANAIAFIFANSFSFWANSYWSFQTAPSRQRYLLFFAVSLAGLTVSILAIAISETLRWHYLVGVSLAFIVLPIVTFFAHKKWTWSNLA